MRIGGFYKSGDIDGLVRSLEQNLGIVAIREADGRVVLVRAPAPLIPRLAPPGPA
jgi:ferric-dicitrate binding protein FerR (iron transport regulator)